MDVAAGAVALAQAAPLFPPGTIHIAVVDPGVGGERADILIEAGGSVFVGPDNGVLSLAARPPRRVYRIESSMFRRDPVSPTFHGRDVFAPTRGAPGRRRARRPTPGPLIDTIVELSAPPLHKQGGVVEGQVIHVDSFGNLITSLPAELLASGRRGEILIEVEGTEGRFTPVFGRTFSDVPSGALIAYIGSRRPAGDRAPRRLGRGAHGGGAGDGRACDRRTS